MVAWANRQLNFVNGRGEDIRIEIGQYVDVLQIHRDKTVTIRCCDALIIPMRAETYRTGVVRMRVPLSYLTQDAEEGEL